MIFSTDGTTTEGKPKKTIEISNGHLDILNKITQDYNIKDVEKTLGFMFAVMSKSEGKPIRVGEDSFVPAIDAINQKEVITRGSDCKCGVGECGGG